MIGRQPVLAHPVSALFSSSHEFGLRTTKMIPSSFTNVYRKVWCSVLYGALFEAEMFAFKTPEIVFSSMKTSFMKLLIIEGLMGAQFRDHTTTPEVVTISNQYGPE